MNGHRSNIHEYTKHIQNNKTQTDEEMIRLGEKTAVMKHIIENNHMFNTTQPKILDRTNRTAKLPILEMCHIASRSNTVNHRTDVDGLSTTYAGLLHSIKKSNSRKRHTTTTIEQMSTEQTVQNHHPQN